MKDIFKLMFLIVMGITCSVRAGLYDVANLEMSGTGATPVEAKNNAIIQGELAAFDRMIAGLIGPQNEEFFERPKEEEILEMVRDFSIVEEKNTNTAYWGKLNVRFKEKSIQELLKKFDLMYLQKEPPVYWLLPVWNQGGDRWTLEDENPFYQVLKTQTPIADSFQMVLPNGDVKELILAARSLETQDFTEMTELARTDKAEKILVVAVQYNPDDYWEMRPGSYAGTENAFHGLSVQGNGVASLAKGWQDLTQKMAGLWQEKYRSTPASSHTYYARFNSAGAADWPKLKRDLNRLGFLENLTLQGAMPGQFLFQFRYAGDEEKLISELNAAGFVWTPDSNELGTLKRKETDENIL